MSNVVLPQPAERIVTPEGRVSVIWFSLFRQLVALVNSPVAPSYTVADLPSDAIVGALAFVTDEAGGAVLASFDGTNWRRSTDRAIVS